MWRRLERWLDGLTFAGLVRFFKLESLALTTRKTFLIHSAPNREWAIHFSLVRVGLMRADDSRGWVIPFFKRKDAWQAVDIEHGPISESRSQKLLFVKHRTVYHVRRGGNLTLSGWAIDLMPISVAIGMITWPIRLIWRFCWPVLAPAVARKSRQRKLRRNILRQVSQGEQCPACGYDLRATLDRCPECGVEFIRKTVVIAASEAAVKV